MLQSIGSQRVGHDWVTELGNRLKKKVPLGILEHSVNINIYTFYRRQKFIQENHKEWVIAYVFPLGELNMYFYAFTKDISQNKGVLVPAGLENKWDWVIYLHVHCYYCKSYISSINKLVLKYQFFWIFSQLAL